MQAVAPVADLRILKGKALVINQDAQLLQAFEDSVGLRALPMSSGRYPLYTPAHQGCVGHYAPTLYGYGSLADHAWYLFKAGATSTIMARPIRLKMESLSLHFPRFNSQLGADLVNRTSLLKCLCQPLQ